MDKMIYTPEECARHMNVPKQRVLALLDSGELAGHLEGGEWRIHIMDLEKYLDQKTAREILEWMAVKGRVRDEVAVRIADTAKEIATGKAKAEGFYIIPDWILHEAYEEARHKCRVEIKQIVAKTLKEVSSDPARRLKDAELDEIILTTYAK